MVEPVVAPSRPGRGKKLLLALAALLLAAVAVEGLFRLVGPDLRPGKGVIYAANGQEVPLGEIVAALTRVEQAFSELNRGVEPPFGKLQAGVKMRMGYQPPARWDYFDPNGCVAVDTNSRGFRDEEFAVRKAPGELRILCMGDSLTYGQGVRLDLTWPQQLEARLRGERNGPVEVINGGFAAGPGVNTPDGYDRWVAEHGVLFEPDVVVVGICLNDVGPVDMLTYDAVPLRPVLGGFSRMLDVAVQSYEQSRARTVKRDYAARIREKPAAWNGTQRGLVALRDLLRARDVPLVVAIFPMMCQLEPELYPCTPVHEMIATFCREQDIRVVDLLPDFYGMRDQDLWVHPTDQHPNHVGHAIFARRIHDFLAAEGLLGAR
ncbi:MAG: hypothetical protein RL398_2779 [Planctomycetota bacterium]